MWCNFKKLSLITRFPHFRKQWLLKVFGPLKQQYFLTISLDTCCMYYSISHLSQKLCSAYLKTIHRTNTQRKLSMVLKGSSEPSETTSLFPLWYSGLKDKIWCSNHGWHVVGGVGSFWPWSVFLPSIADITFKQSAKTYSNINLEIWGCVTSCSPQGSSLLQAGLWH